MIRNYIVVALRGVLRDKAYTALNVLGLAVGMASCLLVAGFVQLETSYDEQHTKADRIYRVLRETRDANGVPRFDHGTSGPLAAAIQAEIPEVELATRMWAHWISVKSGDRHLYRSVAVVDPAFFEIFDFEMLSGSLSDVESPERSSSPRAMPARSSVTMIRWVGRSASRVITERATTQSPESSPIQHGPRSAST